MTKSGKDKRGAIYQAENQALKDRTSAQDFKSLQVHDLCCYLASILFKKTNANSDLWTGRQLNKLRPIMGDTRAPLNTWML